MSGGLRGLRKRVVRAVRTDPRLRRATYAAVDAVVRRGPVTGLRGAPAGVAGDPESWPVVLVVVLQTTPDRLERLARGVAELQALGEAVRPLFLVDAPAFAPLRRHGFAAEYVPPRAGWEPGADGGDWTDVLAGRLRECREAYAPAATVVLPWNGADAGGGIGELEVLAAVAASAATPSGGGVGRGTRLRRWIDQGS
jgi:hypothetical protein